MTRHAATLAAGATGAIPIPGPDATIITVTQIALPASLAIIYNEPAETVKAAVLPTIVRSGGILAASSLAELVPGLGNVIQAAVAAGLTQGLGQLVATHLTRRAEARLEGRVPPDFDFGFTEFARFFNEALKTKRGVS